MKVIYRTNDGKEFDTQDAALVHEKTLINVEQLKLEVNELLNQVLFKLKDVEAAKASYQSTDYYDGYQINKKDELVDLNLSCIKGVVEILTSKYDYEREQLITHYYNSSASC